MQRYQRHDLRSHQIATDALVPGHAPAHAVQEQRRRAGAQASPGRLLQDRLADQAQAHGGHALARGGPPARRAGGDRRRLPGRGTHRRQGRARLGEQGAVRRRRADHARRKTAVHVSAPATLHQRTCRVAVDKPDTFVVPALCAVPLAIDTHDFFVMACFLLGSVRRAA